MPRLAYDRGGHEALRGRVVATGDGNGRSGRRGAWWGLGMLAVVTGALLGRRGVPGRGAAPDSGPPPTSLPSLPSPHDVDEIDEIDEPDVLVPGVRRGRRVAGVLVLIYLGLVAGAFLLEATGAARTLTWTVTGMVAVAALVIRMGVRRRVAPDASRRQRVMGDLASDVGIALLTGAVVSLAVIAAEQSFEEDRFDRDIRRDNVRFVRETSSQADQAAKPFSNLDLQEAQLEGLRLDGADFTGANLLRARLGGADLSSATLVDAELSGSDMELAVLIGADLSFADLEGANLEDADATGATFYEAQGERLNLFSAVLVDADLTNADLNDAILISARAVGANLSHADLSDAWLSSAILDEAVLTAADLRRVAGAEIGLVGADLTDARLDGAALVRAEMGSANLTDANLTGANLTAVDLRRSTAVGADFTDAKLDLVDLSGAILTGADLTGASLTDVIYDSTTVWPDGFTPPTT